MAESQPKVHDSARGSQFGLPKHVELARYPDGDLRIPLPKQATGRNVGSPGLKNQLAPSKSAQTSRPAERQTDSIDLGATQERLEDKFMVDVPDPRAVPRSVRGPPEEDASCKVRPRVEPHGLPSGAG